MVYAVRAMHDLSVTVVAVATPPGRGGVGCVRVSGPEASSIAKQIFRPKTGKVEPGDSRPRFGRFLGRDGRPLDHGYCVIFPEGSSFTGELTTELWAHGSPAVLAELIQAAVQAGAEPAGPGEFTYRALRHGKLDLARAEAVRDLVAARTLYQARVAFSQAEGALSRRLAPLREELTELIARGEAAVEFVDESETHLTHEQLGRGIVHVREACARLLEDFRTGRLVREGATLVITGLPNVGKSSLFNRLLARERAIVTEVPGTTRDTLEEAVQLDGIPVQLVDTAGLREVADPVESEGVRRAHAARQEADLVLLVLDGTRELQPAEREVLARLDPPASREFVPPDERPADREPLPPHERPVAGKARPGAEQLAHGERTVVVVNKVDLPGVSDRPLPEPSALRVSALTGDGIDRLRRALRERLVGTGPVESPILTDARHARALEEAAAALDRATAASRDGLTEELVLEDLREAMQRLGEITGEFGTEDLYDLIFSTFCIGK